MWVICRETNSDELLGEFRERTKSQGDTILLRGSNTSVELYIIQ